MCWIYALLAELTRCVRPQDHITRRGTRFAPILRPADSHPRATAQQPSPILRLAFPQPYSTAQEPGDFSLNGYNKAF